jgi:hypothetical protein
MSDKLRIDPGEPCEQCGAQGDSKLYMLAPNRPVVWCGLCYDTWTTKRTRAKEHALLAEWGTLGQKRQA